MTPADYLRFFAALVFVLALMGGLALVLKRLGLTNSALPTAGQKRLRVAEVIPLDRQRRLALIRRDTTEHLIILGPNGETVVETGIQGDISLNGKSGNTVAKPAADTAATAPPAPNNTNGPA